MSASDDLARMSARTAQRWLRNFIREEQASLQGTGHYRCLGCGIRTNDGVCDACLEAASAVPISAPIIKE